MNWTVNGHHILLMLSVTFITSILLIPIIKKLANHVGAVDVPEKRKVHTKITPRMGGLAIFLAFLTGYIFFGKISTQMISILIGSFLIILLGILDDIKPIRAIYKFMVQVLAASVIVLYGNICLQDIGAFGIYINFISDFYIKHNFRIMNINFCIGKCMKNYFSQIPVNLF